MQLLPLEQRRTNQITYPLTVLFSSQSNSMEQNRYSEADSFSANPEIPRMFMVHCRVHKSPPLVPIPGQITPVYDIQPHFKIHFNSIISSTSRFFFKWSLTFRVLHQDPVCIFLLLPTPYSLRPSHPPSCGHPNDV